MTAALSRAAISACRFQMGRLMHGVLVRFPLRQTESFVRSLMGLMKLDLTAHDHSTLSRQRRKIDVYQYRWPPKLRPDIVILPGNPDRKVNVQAHPLPPQSQTFIR